MREECPFANESCKYFNRATPHELRGVQEHGCFSDRSHPYFPKKIVAQIGATAMNNDLAVQECRNAHDERHATAPYNLPTYTELAEWKRARQGQSNGLPKPN